MPKSVATKTSIVGIDLGTTRSVVAAIDSYGRPTTLPNSEGDLTTPSAVYLDDDSILVGKEAIKALVFDPKRGAAFVKREIGNQQFKVSVAGIDYPVELIQSFILCKLRADAERSIGRPITEAVITVPAFFNEPKRRATIDAGRLAGLDVKAVINEPTAAALAFRFGNDDIHEQSLAAPSENVIVYDLGGGTFDVSLLKISGNQIQVIGIDGNSRLGGLDWDACVADWLAEQFSTQFGISAETLQHSRAVFLREAEELKHTLTAKKQTTVRMQLFGCELQMELSCQTFEQITAHLLQRTRFTVRKLLQECRYGWNQIDRILLVGGSTRMRQVSAMLKDESDTVVDCSISPDQAVAHGAAIFAQMFYGDAPRQPTNEINVTDVSAHHLGVLGLEVVSGQPRGHVMIPRNTPLPAQQSSRFETLKNNQRSVIVRVVEGGDASGKHASKIGTFTVHDLPAGLPAGSPVDVMLKYNRDGIIDAEAAVVDTGRKASIRVERTAGLSSQERKHWHDHTRQIYRKLGVETDDAPQSEPHVTTAGRLLTKLIGREKFVQLRDFDIRKIFR